MKRRILHNIVLALAALGMVSIASAGGAKAPAKAKASDEPKAEPKPLLSVFEMPKTPADGRDPFYPKSMRPYISDKPVVATKAAPAPIDADLALKGLSGPADHRLALVNNHTFEAGESAEVSTTTGRLRITCVKILPDAVVVQIGSERRELRLKGVL
ncbi:MAG TPA: hypothetical protein VHH88_04055 [Verrucomicrobiae bacterium]|nr:hypothetical protein [Verrucomicrobiae bacterium]